MDECPICHNLQSNQFRFNGQIYKYFVHTFNSTRHNERAVEVAIALDLINKNQEARILEVGNTLNNYINFKHDVVDKYDASSDQSIIRQDIVDYNTKERYDLILSVSTFEHIGYDGGEENEERWKGKIATALDHTKTLLNDKGLLMITMPLGYNTELDQLLEHKKLSFDEIFCMKRDDYNGWDQIDLDLALTQNYRREPCFLGISANGVQIVVAYITYLVIGFAHGKLPPKNYSVSLSAGMSGAVS